MKQVFTALVFTLFVGQPAMAQTHSAESVASAVLHGYLAQDVTMLIPFMNETNQSFVRAYNEDPTQFGNMFGGNRGDAGTSWNGMILPARYTIEPDGSRQAVIPFAIETGSGNAPLGTPGDGRYIAVVLTLDTPTDTSWGFEDVNYIHRHQYEGLLNAP